jgi:hypothetical protein
MLKQILAEFQAAQTPLGVAELSQKLALDSGVLEGMLQTLLRQNRLQEIKPIGYDCATCPVKGGCFIFSCGAPKQYILK